VADGSRATGGGVSHQGGANSPKDTAWDGEVHEAARQLPGDEDQNGVSMVSAEDRRRRSVGTRISFAIHYSSIYANYNA
jgi:hypothetical protein